MVQNMRGEKGEYILIIYVLNSEGSERAFKMIYFYIFILLK